MLQSHDLRLQVGELAVRVLQLRRNLLQRRLGRLQPCLGVLQALRRLLRLALGRRPRGPQAGGGGLLRGRDETEPRRLALHRAGFGGVPVGRFTQGGGFGQRGVAGVGDVLGRFVDVVELPGEPVGGGARLLDRCVFAKLCGSHPAAEPGHLRLDDAGAPAEREAAPDPRDHGRIRQVAEVAHRLRRVGSEGEHAEPVLVQHLEGGIAAGELGPESPDAEMAFAHVGVVEQHDGAAG